MSIIDRLFDSTYPGLSKALDLAWRRNQAITSNIANAETPQYRAIDLNFAGELERAFNRNVSELTTTHANHMDVGDAGAAHYVPDLSGATKPDGNNVDLDIQMGRLSVNSGRYSTASAILRKKLGILKMAMRQSGS